MCTLTTLYIMRCSDLPTLRGGVREDQIGTTTSSSLGGKELPLCNVNKDHMKSLDTSISLEQQGTGEGLEES